MRFCETSPPPCVCAHTDTDILKHTHTQCRQMLAFSIHAEVSGNYKWMDGKREDKEKKIDLSKNWKTFLLLREQVQKYIEQP